MIWSLWNLINFELLRMAFLSLGKEVSWRIDWIRILFSTDLWFLLWVSPGLLLIHLFYFAPAATSFTIVKACHASPTWEQFLVVSVVGFIYCWFILYVSVKDKYKNLASLITLTFSHSNGGPIVSEKFHLCLERKLLSDYGESFYITKATAR